MNEAYRPFLLDEKRRPFTAREKRQWKLRYEPRMYDYELIPLEKLYPKPETQETPESKMAAGLMFILALLSSLIDLPTGEDFGIEGEGKTETPQSTLMAKS